jgi:hypothetical protein
MLVSSALVTPRRDRRRARWQRPRGAVARFRPIPIALLRTGRLARSSREEGERSASAWRDLVAVQCSRPPAGGTTSRAVQGPTVRYARRRAAVYLARLCGVPGTPASTAAPASAAGARADSNALARGICEERTGRERLILVAVRAAVAIAVAWLDAHHARLPARPTWLAVAPARATAPRRAGTSAESRPARRCPAMLVGPGAAARRRGSTCGCASVGARRTAPDRIARAWRCSQPVGRRARWRGGSHWRTHAGADPATAVAGRLPPLPLQTEFLP